MYVFIYLSMYMYIYTCNYMYISIYLSIDPIPSHSIYTYGCLPVCFTNFHSCTYVTLPPPPSPPPPPYMHQVLLQCLPVLKSLPNTLLTSKHAHIITGIHHMIATIGHYIVKVCWFLIFYITCTIKLYNHHHVLYGLYK